uniref:Uncharacterized protein n=2 Tax=Pandoraea faecigallinarum TaxID=656179 RepID=A0A0H3WNI8_9BURK
MVSPPSLDVIALSIPELKMPDNKTVTFDASQYQLVPKVPTEGMLKAGSNKKNYGITSDVYVAMLAAAPTPAAQSAGQEAETLSATVKDRIDELEIMAGAGKICAAALFTQMRQLINASAAPVNGGEREPCAYARTKTCNCPNGQCEVLGVHRAADAPKVGGDTDRIKAIPTVIMRTLDGRYVRMAAGADELIRRSDALAALTSPAKVGGDEREAFIDKCICLLEASRHAARVVGIEHIETFPYLPEYDEAVDWLKENRAALSADGGETLPPVDGDVLPAIGSRVQIHLASIDAWRECTVAGYYAWRSGGVERGVYRVFVRVRMDDGSDNARMVDDVRPAIAARAKGDA